MIDAEGLDSLSMRKLAGRLGVSAMTLYGYVRTKEELLDAIAHSALSRLEHAARGDGAWAQRLARTVTGLHELLLAHPGVTQIIGARGVPIPALDGFREQLLSILDEAGLEVPDAVECVALLMCYTFGFAAIEHDRRTMDPEVEASRLRGLSRTAYPQLVRAADVYAGHVTADAFSAGLGHVIAGIAARARS